jgi:hypothetical protein
MSSHESDQINSEKPTASAAEIKTAAVPVTHAPKDGVKEKAVRNVSLSRQLLELRAGKGGLPVAGRGLLTGSRPSCSPLSRRPTSTPGARPLSISTVNARSHAGHFGKLLTVWRCADAIFIAFCCACANGYDGSLMTSIIAMEPFQEKFQTGGSTGSRVSVIFSLYTV